MRVSNPPVEPRAARRPGRRLRPERLRPQAPGPDDRHQPGLRPVEPARTRRTRATAGTSPGSTPGGSRPRSCSTRSTSSTGVPRAVRRPARLVPGHPAPRRRLRLLLPRRLRPAQARERLRVRAVGRGQPLADPPPAQLRRDPGQARRRHRPGRRARRRHPARRREGRRTLPARPRPRPTDDERARVPGLPGEAEGGRASCGRGMKT